MNILLKNIEKLVQVETEPVMFKSGKEMSDLKVIDNAWLYIEEGLIHSFGSMRDFEKQKVNSSKDVVTEIDAKGPTGFPLFL